MSNKKIIIIDDSFEIIRVLKSAIFTIDPEIEVFATPSAEEAMLEITKGDMDLIITDIHLPGISGLELLRKIRAKHPTVKIIVISGMPDSDIADKVREAGGNIFLRKPIEMALFLDTTNIMLGLKVVSKKQTAPLVAGLNILVSEDHDKNLATSLFNLMKEVSAQHVWLLSESGRITAQSGVDTITDFEENWAPFIMPIMSAAATFSQKIEGKHPERAVLSFGIENHNLFLVPVHDYSLIVLTTASRGSLRIPLVVDVLLEYQQEIIGLLNRIGVVPSEPSLEMEKPERMNLVHELPENDQDDKKFKKIFEKKTELPAIDKFWNEIDIAKTYDLNNPEILSFDQAAKLGLAPESDDEE